MSCSPMAKNKRVTHLIRYLLSNNLAGANAVRGDSGLLRASLLLVIFYGETPVDGGDNCTHAPHVAIMNVVSCILDGASALEHVDLAKDRT